MFGEEAEVLKAVLLARHPNADTGEGEVDRVCFGLRQILKRKADVVERRALSKLEVGEPDARGPRALPHGA